MDPARAPVARIVGARVMTFCSAACADGRPEARVAPAPAAAKPTHARAEPTPAPAPEVEAAWESDWELDVEPELEDVIELYDVVATPGDERVADAAPARPLLRRRRPIIALSAAVLLGGMAIAIIEAVSPSTPSKVSADVDRAATAPPDQVAATRAAGASEPADDDEVVPSPADPKVALERAEHTLREVMASPSPRMQRIAAMALSRLGDEDAIARLRDLLDGESSDIGKVEIAYALARAGDVTGKKLLVKRLRHGRRDVRLDAARSLVELGDDRGVEPLRSMLSIRTYRLGVAEILARAGDDRGIEVLTQTLDSQRASDEEKMRAAVALGRSGDESVRQQLYDIMKDGRFQVGAAAALAAIGDDSAVPALTSQLAHSSLRVEAAEALRRLGVEVDLTRLVAALETENDVGKVSAAEAVLVLAGGNGD